MKHPPLAPLPLRLARSVSPLLFALAAAAPAGAGPAERGGSRVDYTIRARLDGEAKRLAGEETIHWTNRTDAAAGELWFHLYHNAFANTASTHLVESGGRFRGGTSARGRERDEWGWQRVVSVTVDGVDVTPTFRYRHPDSGEGGDAEASEDRTVFSVELSRPVPPGGEATIEVVWEGRLPRVRRRTGYKDDFLLVAHWFPKLGVFEGERGWNCHEFHANTEFYSDYGTYQVTLDLPAIYHEKVGGSGKKVRDEVQGERVEVVFEAPSRADRERSDAFGKRPLVHAFTWTGDPRFVVVQDHPFRWKDWAERFHEEVAKAQAAQGPDVDVTCRDVNITVLIHPERIDQAERHARATQAALFFYGLWFGEYPYEHITVVDPPWGGDGAGGMEYPTLFTAGTSMFTTEDMHRPEGVTVHECGHQFWYGLVGNNEFEAAWMDEGFNSYTDSEVLKLVYGDRRATTSYGGLPFDGVRRASLPGGGRIAGVLTAANWSFRLPLPGLDRDLNAKIRPLRSSDFVDWWRDQPLLTLSPQWDDPRWEDRGGYLRDPDSDPIDRDAWTYVDRNGYRTNSYPRPAVMLRTLRGFVGEEAFLRGMRHYAGERRYRHPYPDDFFLSFQEGAGVDIAWFFEDAFRSTKTIDWSVDVQQSRGSEPEGYFQGEDGVWRKRESDHKDGGQGEGDRDAQAEETPADAGGVEEGEGGDGEGDRPWQVDILLRRKGEFCLPLRWEVRYEEGDPDVFEWTREEQLEQTWYRWKFESDRKVTAVVLDPERLYWIDRDMSNNQWFDRTSDLPAWRWAERVFIQYQNLLHWYGGLGG